MRYSIHRAVKPAKWVRKLKVPHVLAGTADQPNKPEEGNDVPLRPSGAVRKRMATSVAADMSLKSSPERVSHEAKYERLIYSIL